MTCEDGLVQSQIQSLLCDCFFPVLMRISLASTSCVSLRIRKWLRVCTLIALLSGRGAWTSEWDVSIQFRGRWAEDQKCKLSIYSIVTMTIYTNINYHNEALTYHPPTTRYMLTTMHSLLCCFVEHWVKPNFEIVYLFATHNLFTWCENSETELSKLP